jgi:glycosyltransferase involved in cell wall biosynthesis
VATLNPGKGHDILFRALAAHKHAPWYLTCAGSLDRHPQTVTQLRARLRTDALEDRVSLVGDVDATTLASCYHGADLFVLATLHETYGMAVAEALARGLPVISTATGAIGELVGDDAGFVVPPGDVGALTTALAKVRRRAPRARLAEARDAPDRPPTWDRRPDKDGRGI